jgi:type II secretory pathway pseudopilin PulG
VSIPRRGFSLVDLLVSVSVIVILMAVLLPALRLAHEAARRARCAHNIHQLALGVEMYVHDNRDHLPPSLYDEQPAAQSYNRGAGGAQAQSSSSPPTHQDTDEGTDTMFLRYRSLDPNAGEPLWDGLGILMGENYLNHPGVFYCPSHHGDHPYSAYADEWVNGQGLIASNYQYRIPEESSYLSDLDRQIKLVADGMRTRSDYNHVIGNNFMRADLSVGWFSDVNGVVYSSLPETLTINAGGTPLHNPWRTLDGE